ncbi:MAG: hypothetical protein J1F66_00850 [Clostridiales bacterium]|nr:hypothetical protein [Clostridiales bacterium]
MACKKQYNENIYYGYIIKGQLKRAIAYLRECGQTELCQKYIDLFENEKYLTFDVDDYLNEILLIYQKYYRDVFYFETQADQAAETMRRGFVRFFEIEDENVKLCEIENGCVAEAFERRSYHYLGGKTSGYYGPYIWRSAELKHYSVELPNGSQEYTVKLLDGFVSKGWYDYISFGALGASG